MVQNILIRKYSLKPIALRVTKENRSLGRFRNETVPHCGKEINDGLSPFVFEPFLRGTRSFFVRKFGQRCFKRAI